MDKRERDGAESHYPECISVVSERGNGVCNVDASGDAVNKCLVKPLSRFSLEFRITA